MAALLISILKMTVSPERLTLERLGVGDGEIDKFDVGSGMEYVKKSEKISSLKIWLSQEKSSQKVEIQLISILQRPNQNS